MSVTVFGYAYTTACRNVFIDQTAKLDVCVIFFKESVTFYGLTKLLVSGSKFETKLCILNKMKATLSIPVRLL